ncbi:hypothetical protein N431DRAFT_472428 [Stipitochalara longipes BDJ]|nr:hypothetical protein N431DRAFT_472428 [Stipitochalara longipes BDJ]
MSPGAATLMPRNLTFAPSPNCRFSIPLVTFLLVFPACVLGITSYHITSHSLLPVPGLITSNQDFKLQGQAFKVHGQAKYSTRPSLDLSLLAAPPRTPGSSGYNSGVHHPPNPPKTQSTHRI